MKMNKLNHLSIISLFAIAFIVVYLYYTISDVKKIHSEVKRLTQDIEKMNMSISNITTTILPMLSFPVQTSNDTDKMTTNATYTPQCIQKTFNMPMKEEDKDTESVGSQELHNIMETIDDEEKPKDVEDIEDGEEETTMEEKFDITEPVQNNIDTVDNIITTNITTDLNTLSVEELKKLSYADIRKFCKMNNIDDKGTKEVLIFRIKNSSKPL
jgi:hypothetical protein